MPRWLGWAARVVAGSAASYLYSTGPGKRAIWVQLLDELGLRGDEHVLDVGCGRGAVLMLAARRLPGGRLRIVDAGADRYADVLRDAGCTDVGVRRLDWRTWYGIPGHHLPVVTAAGPPG